MTPPFSAEVPVLSPERLNQMIHTALAQPQVVPARAPGWSVPTFALWARPLKAVLASVALLMVIGTVMTATYMPDSAATNSDAMAEISDMMTLDLLENLS